MSTAPTPESRRERRGRLAGVVLLATIVTAFTAICSVEIILQAWGIGGAGIRAPGVDCKAGLLGLVRSLERARSAASRVPGERAAIASFRGALGPAWMDVGALTRSCRADPPLAAAVEEIVRLRFSEERTLRYEALDVAERRRAVADIERRLLR